MNCNNIKYYCYRHIAVLIVQPALVDGGGGTEERKRLHKSRITKSFIFVGLDTGFPLVLCQTA